MDAHTACPAPTGKPQTASLAKAQGTLMSMST
jgi:hypothetical protein